ncbi:MoaD/ThiS family protein [Paucibacter sp. APW11]|uniref:MoaD/ThiS family protein n=1 Tax=Roseateles aquae TaxID=3077235 RepID=A0ABU3PBC6_9BURK|nr:MoaD/ThiS family protein [Paucibacter sp. APW11]MDT8999867.1 MoaD/ThiS family protein [Paucibacter sp. APW11]
MTIQIEIPAIMRRFAAQQQSVGVEAADLDTALRELVSKHPRMRAHLFDAHGDLRRIVNVFVNGNHVRWHERANTKLEPGDSLCLVPLFAGG